MGDRRLDAAEAYVQSMRTGESSAAARAGGYLAPDVLLSTGREEYAGRAEVLKRITGQWPLTPVYLQGAWSAPTAEGDCVRVHAEFPSLGAAPKSVDLKFTFDSAGMVSRIDQQNGAVPPPETSDTLPDFVRGLVNGALANGTPMAVAYVDDEGRPVQTLRGSTQVFSDHQLCIWLRNPESGVARAMQRNPALSLLYRDSKSRTTLIIQGRGHVEADPAVRERVFGLSPEVEQTHDPGRRGLALIIDVERMQGTSPRGPVRMERTA